MVVKNAAGNTSSSGWRECYCLTAMQQPHCCSHDLPFFSFRDWASENHRPGGSSGPSGWHQLRTQGVPAGPQVSSVLQPTQLWHAFHFMPSVQQLGSSSLNLSVSRVTFLKRIPDVYTSPHSPCCWLVEQRSTPSRCIHMAHALSVYWLDFLSCKRKTGCLLTPLRHNLSRYCAPEQYIMSTQTPSAPPPPVAAALSPVLWQLNLPDRFDVYSAGLIMLQMVRGQAAGVGQIRLSGQSGMFLWFSLTRGSLSRKEKLPLGGRVNQGGPMCNQA